LSNIASNNPIVRAFVDVSNHFVDLLLLGLETESTHRDLELLGINGARTVSVKEVEGLLDLLQSDVPLRQASQDKRRAWTRAKRTNSETIRL
jgi:hypothetical protein